MIIYFAQFGTIENLKNNISMKNFQEVVEGLMSKIEEKKNARLKARFSNVDESCVNCAREEFVRCFQLFNDDEKKAALRTKPGFASPAVMEILWKNLEWREMLAPYVRKVNEADFMWMLKTGHALKPFIQASGLNEKQLHTFIEYVNQIMKEGSNDEKTFYKDVVAKLVFQHGYYGNLNEWCEELRKVVEQQLFVRYSCKVVSEGVTVCLGKPVCTYEFSLYCRWLEDEFDSVMPYEAEILLNEVEYDYLIERYPNFRMSNEAIYYKVRHEATDSFIRKIFQHEDVYPAIPQLRTVMYERRQFFKVYLEVGFTKERFNNKKGL